MISFVHKIYNATIRIDLGRKGFAIIGKEREGRLSYEYGIIEKNKKTFRILAF